MGVRERYRAVSMLAMVISSSFVACSNTQQASQQVQPSSGTTALIAEAPSRAPTLAVSSAVTTTMGPTLAPVIVEAASPTASAPPTPSPAPSPSETVPVAQATTRPLATLTRTATVAVPQAPATTALPPTNGQATSRAQRAVPATAIATTAVHTVHYLFPIAPASLGSYGTCHHDYPASDIFVPIGSHFVAVIGGVVDFVSYQDLWNPAINSGASRGGLSVAIIGDDGTRYYGSHLSKIADGIAPGVRVRAGQLLGLSGQSGDARVTAPHVHFGISRATAPDDWATRRGMINPYRYLNAWRSGIDLVPDLTRVGGGVC